MGKHRYWRVCQGEMRAQTRRLKACPTPRATHAGWYQRWPRVKQAFSLRFSRASLPGAAPSGFASGYGEDGRWPSDVGAGSIGDLTLHHSTFGVRYSIFRIAQATVKMAVGHQSLEPVPLEDLTLHHSTFGVRYSESLRSGIGEDGRWLPVVGLLTGLR